MRSNACACRCLVPDGTHIDQDTPFAEIEVMKQIMLMMVPAGGTISFEVAEGCVLQAGDLVATLELDQPDAVAKGEPFMGSLPALGPPQVASNSIDYVFKRSMRLVDMILAGASSSHCCCSVPLLL